MTHDPMCPIACDCEDNESGQHWLLYEKRCESCWSYCQCPLISKVRADQEVETLSDVADAAILFLGYTGDEVRKLTVDAVDALRNSR